MTLIKSPSSPREAADETKIQIYFNNLRDLLEAESEAEVRQLAANLERKTPAEAEKAGLSLTSLHLQEVSYGLAGRTILTLGKNNRTPLPWTQLKSGSPVVLRPQGIPNTPLSWRATVVAINSKAVEVALEFIPDDLEENGLFRLDFSTDEVTLKRQKDVLQKVQKASYKSRDSKEARLAELRDVLLGEGIPYFGSTSPYEKEPAHPLETLEKWDHPAFLRTNPSQKAAISHALQAQDVAIIHGPPGTGKTTTLAAFISVAASRGEKILVSAASNLAVDNVLERLIPLGVRAIRVGHPARVLPELRAHTLDYLVLEHEDFRLASSFRKEAHKLFHEADRFRRVRPEPGDKAKTRREARDLLREAKRLEQQAVDRILDQAQVICVTASAIDSKILGERYFDRVVMDESGQATEPTTWLPIPWGKTLILAGDHLQLPPTVTSPKALAQGLAVSLMEKLVHHYGPTITRTLDIQYRMHETIMGFSSMEFYAGALSAHESVRHHLLQDLLETSEGASPLSRPLRFVDTAGANFEDKQDALDQSRYNPKEADLLVHITKEYLALGVQSHKIGIIAPYAAQVKLLRKLLTHEVEGLEIETVDGFQGREKELILISLVRSNPEGEIGFLKEWRRLNVAFTRAKRCLVVIGDSATLSHHDFFLRWLDYVTQAEAHETVWEREGFLP